MFASSEDEYTLAKCSDGFPRNDDDVVDRTRRSGLYCRGCILVPPQTGLYYITRASLDSALARTFRRTAGCLPGFSCETRPTLALTSGLRCRSRVMDGERDMALIRGKTVCFGKKHTS